MNKYTLRCLHCGHIYELIAQGETALKDRLNRKTTCGSNSPHITEPSALHYYEIIKEEVIHER